jgi:hypothetical protein
MPRIPGARSARPRPPVRDDCDGPEGPSFKKGTATPGSKFGHEAIPFTLTVRDSAQTRPAVQGPAVVVQFGASRRVLGQETRAQQ